jgi:methylated-DNA-protein-cysteine methyltransferase-like protein
MNAAAYRRAVLNLVARIPPGKVLSYGAIAAHLAEVSGRASPRLVGQIMARSAEPVPWHRVVRADGRPARGHEAEALRRLRDDGTPLRGTGVDMVTAGWSIERPPRRPRGR